MSKKPRKKTAGKQAAKTSSTLPAASAASRYDLHAQSGHGADDLSAALARRSARTGSRGTNPTTSNRPKTAKATRSDVASLRVDEEQYPSGGCAPTALGEADPQGLAVTYSFDAPESTAPYSMAIRFVGTRVGVEGKSAAGDRFERVERIDGLAAGMGRVSVTARVQGINAGEWKVLASPVEQPGSVPPSGRLSRRVVATRTRFSQLAQGPAVRLAAWPALIGLGAAVAIVLQALLAARAGMNVGAVLALSLVGCVLGFVGGKAWYLVLHRKSPRQFLTAGACIQGFLLAALGVVALGAVLFGLPARALLDVTTPGIFFGMAMGRPGCFLTGCCAGRPTVSRWGLWSSNRRYAIRRFPVQLVEAGMALLLGLVSLILVLTVPLPAPGAVFTGTLAAYTFGRQLLFPMRTESRTARGRAVTMAACGLLLAAAIGVSVLA